MSDPSSANDPVQVICIKWGTIYFAEDVNKLRSMLERNSSRPIQLHLFTTDPSEGLHENIEVHPEPGLNIAKEDDRYSY